MDKINMGKCENGYSFGEFAEYLYAGSEFPVFDKVFRWCYISQKLGIMSVNCFMVK